MRYQRKNEIHCLDGFRGLLATWVFWFHFGFFDERIYKDHALKLFMSGGILGVDGFFALSGFILMHVYQNYFENFEGFKTFFKNFFKFLYFRISRIWPLHVLMSLLWVREIKTKFTNSEWGCNYDDFFIEITMTTPIFRKKETEFVGICNSPSWSIVNEFYAYLCFPFLVLLIVKCNKTNSLFKNIIMIFVSFWSIVLFKNIIYYVKNHEWINVLLVRNYIDKTIFEFLTGMILYRIYDKYQKKHWINDVIVLALMIVTYYLTSTYFIDEHATKYMYIILVFPLFLAKMNSFMFKILNSDIFKFLGDISFSFYLSQLFWLEHVWITVLIIF